MPQMLPRRLALVLAVLLFAPAPAWAGGGFDDPALVARLLPSVVAIAIDVPAPTAADAAATKLEHASGFVIDPAGMILTNGHVVDNARAIRVVLSDGATLPARLLYQAPVDLALIQVDAGRPLPAVTWGDSDRLRPGDGVIAIGNPLGIGISVSAGIVSAMGRDIHATAQDDFIQTDAALNHGNSGGPLFNLKGEVVGVATGLLAPKGESGSIGIGLAMPGDTAQFVVDSFRRYGRVRQGWIGAAVAAITPGIADSLNLPAAQGVLVTAAPPQTPAGQAGLRVGDVILRAGGRPVADPRGLQRLVGTAPVGGTLHLALLRDAAAATVDVVVGEAAEPPAPPAPPAPAMTAGADLGLDLAPLDAAARVRLHLPADTTGVLVAGIAPGSLAAGWGLAAGDVIARAQWAGVTRPEEVRARIEAARDSGRGHVLLAVRAPDGLRLVAVPLKP